VGYDVERWDMLRTFACSQRDDGEMDVVSSTEHKAAIVWNIRRQLSRLEPGLRGVSLGGWLVPERWMTPDLFSAAGTDDAIDMWTLCESVGYERAGELLDYHYSQFLNLREDMRWLAQHGFTAVRRPSLASVVVSRFPCDRLSFQHWNHVPASFHVPVKTGARVH
jgi:hypothetical protein